MLVLCEEKGGVLQSHMAVNLRLKKKGGRRKRENLKNFPSPQEGRNELFAVTSAARGRKKKKKRGKRIVYHHPTSIDGEKGGKGKRKKVAERSTMRKESSIVLKKKKKGKRPKNLPSKLAVKTKGGKKGGRYHPTPSHTPCCQKFWKGRGKRGGQFDKNTEFHRSWGQERGGRSRCQAKNPNTISVCHQRKKKKGNESFDRSRGYSNKGKKEKKRGGSCPRKICQRLNNHEGGERKKKKKGGKGKRGSFHLCLNKKKERKTSTMDSGLRRTGIEDSQCAWQPRGGKKKEGK